ncbi:hypothetical protein RDWZM_003364 [Blomia tropicalis]|uniref:ABC transporter domain-containing protein n=1 Tax=Blomia tropicalis TaxID=40697 RepID=A0A9Q0MFE5_BLOTA|nr:hypothetical protein RDWZM_003364 [Blomia tropicalis]
MVVCEESEVRLTLLDENDGHNRPPSSQPDIEESLSSTSDDLSVELIRSSMLPSRVMIIPAEKKQSTKHGIELVWRNLSFEVKKSTINPFGTKQKRTLINKLNGGIQNGQLTAIIGPSGAGKTTLIECLSGRRINGVTGDIVVNYNGVSKKSIKVSYYSQHDSLNELLTVEESLMYASKLRNCLKSLRKKNTFFVDINSNTKMNEPFPDANMTSERYYHRIVVERLLNELNLKKCEQVPVSQCSGGQKRRLSIALELIFSPSIFLLDEPTSGLDSLSSLQCIAMLKKLVNNSERPMLIATSIHQPTAKIMSYFDQLYIISYNGQCIYNGPTKALVDTLSNFGLHCPQYHNPADFVVEIATGDFGNECIDLLAEQFKQICHDQCNDQQYSQSVKMNKLVQTTQRHGILRQIMTTVVLTKRSLLSSIRDPNIYLSRLVTILSTLVLLVILYKDEKIGLLDGCANRPTRELVGKIQTFELLEEQHRYFGNFGFLFFAVVLVVFMSILPTLLSFPLEVSVFVKENFNGWYSLKSYYLARQIADLPPMLFFPLLFGVPSYFITHQYFEWTRFALFHTVLIMLSFLAQGLGFLVSAYFVKDVTTSTVVGAILNIPMFLFTGLLIRIAIMPKYFQPITYLSYFRLAFESLLVIIYGLNRCRPVESINFAYLKKEFGDEILDMYVCVSEFSTNVSENVTTFIDNYNGQFLSNMSQNSWSYALNSFQYNDDTLMFNLAGMLIYIVLLRVFAYIILYHKTKAK